MMPGAAWLDGQLAGAPDELVARTREFVAAAEPGVSPEGLVRASRAALAAAIAGPSDRGAALNLLAADALVTLALAAGAEMDPDTLDAFAGSIRRAVAGTE